MLTLPRNIYVISSVMALSYAIISMMVFMAGILGAQIAPTPALATLPMAMMVLGTGIATIPAALLMQRVGRKVGMTIGLLISFTGITIACYAAIKADFTLFVIGAVLMGLNAAFTQQGRFIILENATSQSQEADGLTLGLMANLIAAIVGPQLGILGKDLIVGDASFAGSFLFGGGLILVALLILLNFYKDVPVPEPEYSATERPLLDLIKQPIFILAAGSSAVGFGIMSFVMTATPISMHEIDGHSLDHTKLVIQTHIIAMFLPSFISGALLKRGYQNSLIILGLCLYLVVTMIGFAGIAVMHYWWALLILGLGWNLLFMTSTAILPQAYNTQEKFKTQAANEFLVFMFQGVAAFAAGWALFTISWTGVLWLTLTLTISWLLVASRLMTKLPHDNHSRASR